MKLAENNDTIEVNISATDVDEAPGVQGENATTAPDTMHTIEENANLADADDLTNAIAAVQYLATITDTDNEDEEVSLKLGGDDMSAFELKDMDGDGDGEVQVLVFKSAPNYESPTDADGDSTYKVDVIAVDKAGNEKPETVTVVVNNIQEAGTVSVMPVQPGIGQMVTAMLDDEDGDYEGVKWQWYGVGTEPADSTTDQDEIITFSELDAPRKIDGATMSTYTPRAKVDADEEAGIKGYPGDEGDFMVAVVTYKDAAPPTVEDNDATDDVDESAQVVVGATANAVRAVPDVNTAPYFMDDPVELMVKESAEKKASVGTVMAMDDESDILTYTLSGGADMASFKVSAGGEVTVNTDLDYDAGQRMYTIMVTAADPFGGSGSTTVNIMVEGVNEEPEVMGEIPEEPYDENGMDPVATFTASDEDNDPLKWGLEGADATDFDITGGVLSFKKSPDYENPTDRGRLEDPDTDATELEGVGNNVYLVTITATEDVSDREEGEINMKGSKAVTVTVANVEEDGTITITLRQPEVLTPLSAQHHRPLT